MTVSRLRIIVGTGYLGGRVARLWAARGDRVIGTTRSTERAESLAEAGVEPRILDVTTADWPGFFDETGLPDTLFWSVGFDRTAGSSYHDVQVQQTGDARFPAGEIRHYWKAVNLLELSDAAIDRIVHYHRRQPAEENRIALVPVRGAVSRVGDDETAFFGRLVDSQVQIQADWKAPADDEANMEWARNTAADLEAFSDGSRYLNASSGESEAALRSAFRPGYRRLTQLKRKYDPANYFRLNKNINPASAPRRERREAARRRRALTTEHAGER